MTIGETETKIPSPIGESKTRLDAREKATGAAIFADDFQFGPGLLHARIKRSPHPHAHILSIDTSKAEALPGVKAVVTGEDFPGYIGLYLQDRHIFCRETARYIGDPIAGVAATSEEIAEEALELIEVEYEVLEPVLGLGTTRSLTLFCHNQERIFRTTLNFAKATRMAHGTSVRLSSNSATGCPISNTYRSNPTLP